MVESIFVPAAVIGFTQFLKEIRDRNYIGALTIVGAVIIGTVAGLLQIEGLTTIQGTLAGLAASGVITTAQVLKGSK